MGSIRKVGGTWYIRYRRNGRQYEESARSDKKGVAERLLKLREGDSARGVAVTPAINRLTVDDAVADVLTDYKTNGKRTHAHADRRWKLHLLPFFGGRRASTVTTADVRTYIAQRQARDAANATINRELALLKRAFRLAVQGGRLLQAPHVPMLRENNVRTGFFERDQFDAVRRHLPAPLQPVITFAYLTGWRVPSEVLTMEWRQVDWRAGTVRLEPGATKNGEGRTFPFGVLPELHEVLVAQRAERDALAARGLLCPFVFHRNGRPIASFRKAWENACEAAGVPGRLLHDFRRTAVRNLVRAGVPERVSMQLTGHLTRSVFDRYDITSEADLREGVARLAGTSPTSGARSGSRSPS